MIGHAELIELFVGRCREAGAVVLLAGTPAEARSKIIAATGCGEQPSIPPELALELGLEPTPPGGATVVTGTDLAIAATGSVAADLSDPDWRRAVTAARTQIAIVRPDRILPDIVSALKRYEHGFPPYLGLTTGPSRTGDIESVLTIGVHGPGQMIVIIAGWMEGSDDGPATAPRPVTGTR